MTELIHTSYSIHCDVNFFRIFPRVSAVAERLWSAPEVKYAKYAKYRLEEHYCRMNKRGIPAQPPNGPGHCPI
jgi:hexosaminidase